MPRGPGAFLCSDFSFPRFCVSTFRHPPAARRHSLKDACGSSDALLHDVKVKALIRRVEIILRQEEPHHHRIEPEHAADVGDNGNAAALAQIERGPAKNLCDCGIGSAKAFASTGDCPAGVLLRSGGTTT